MPKVNYGKHIIVSQEVHGEMKGMCVKAGVVLNQATDGAMREFVTRMNALSDGEREHELKRLASTNKIIPDASNRSGPAAELPCASGACLIGAAPQGEGIQQGGDVPVEDKLEPQSSVQ